MTELTRSRIEVRGVFSRGYTIVELMMAIAVFAIGVSGIIAMQKVAAAANQHSRALSLATNIAQAWQDQLNADSSLYTRANGFTNTTWLSTLGGNQAVWFRPPWNSTLAFGAAFDELGKPIDETAGDPANAQFCVHLQLTRLYPTSPGIDVVRTEVRVIWPRTEGTASTAFCTANANNAATIGINTDNYHFLYQVSSVRQQP
jgi:prepilin-type N-terminal cleavage/methylation domain-containing protein